MHGRPGHRPAGHRRRASDRRGAHDEPRPPGGGRGRRARRGRRAGGGRFRWRSPPRRHHCAAGGPRRGHGHAVRRPRGAHRHSRPRAHRRRGPRRPRRDRAARAAPARPGVRRWRAVAGAPLLVRRRGGAPGGRHHRRRACPGAHAVGPACRGVGARHMTAVLVALIILVVLGVTLAGASVRILREYERAVVFRVGRLLGAKGPGIVFLIPIVDRMVRVDLRTVTFDVPPQDLIPRDNVPAKVNAVAYYRVIDPVKSVVEVERVRTATSQIAQTTLRSVLGKADLDMLLAAREQLNESLQQIIDDQTDPWGVKVTTVEIKDVGIPQGMQRAMARQAEAERERRAKVINAEGEYQASERLLDAAQIMSENPASLQLRYLQTLLELGSSQASTIVFPLPIDLVKPLLEATPLDGTERHPPEPDQSARSLETAEETREIAGGASGHQRPAEPDAQSDTGIQR